MAALTYLCKLQCGFLPESLTKMVPPSLERPSNRYITRSHSVDTQNWHENMFANPTADDSITQIRRSFPYCAINLWNMLPKELFSNGFSKEYMQKFKVGVNNFLLDLDL